MGHIRAGDGDAARVVLQGQLITVGVASGGSDVVHIDNKRTVALEDVLVALQLLDNGAQSGMHFDGDGVAAFQIAHGNVVLPGFHIEQVVDGKDEVVATNVGVVDGDDDVLLLFCRVAEQRLHLLFQKLMVIQADGSRCDEDADKNGPIQKHQEDRQGDGKMEDKGECQEIAHAYEENQTKNRTTLMPDAPGLDALKKVFEHQTVYDAAAKRDKAEYA